MTTYDLKFQLIEGNWHRGTIKVRDTTTDPNPETAPPLDVSDLDVELYMKPSVEDADPTPLSTVSGEISKTDPLADPVNGVVRVTFTDTHTATAAKNQWWRVDVVNSAGERRTVMAGNYGVTDV